MEIHLDSGETLSLSLEQAEALTEYVNHPANKVPVYDTVTTLTVYQNRWKDNDAWVEFIFTQALAGVFSVVPPSNLIPLKEKVDELNEQKRQAALPIKS